MVQEDPRIVAVGGQVAIANGCTIRHGRVVSVGLPSHPWARFQMVEYLRSFTTGRTGLDRLDSILILSGVFAVFEKETVIRAGGYLTPLVQHRLVEEYVGGSAGTVCEDMEIVVRLHRFVRDKLRRPADRLSAPSGGLDRGARAAGVAAQTAGPLVSRPARVALLSPGHAVPQEVRPDRLVRAADLLAVRVLRPDDRGDGLSLRVVFLILELVFEIRILN